MTRADLFLVEQGLARSRAEAQAAIKAGRVSADGVPVAKASQTLHAGMRIGYAREHAYVSRGALKLIAALDHFGLSPAGRGCLDIGASTGGFTQVLLERGAAQVIAIDAGHDQLHPSLRADQRVRLYEGVNARTLTADIAGAPQVLVADVSFISLTLALPPALHHAAPGAWGVFLVKPQFELGRGAIGKGGIVRPEVSAGAAAGKIAEFVSSVSGWSVQGWIGSPIAGGDGNREFLLAAYKSAGTAG